MLVVTGAAAALLQRRETAEHRRAAFRMQRGREGKADRPLGIQPEHLEEGFIGIGEAAGGIAAEDGVALRVHQALVPDFALIEPLVHRRGIAQGGFQPRR